MPRIVVNTWAEAHTRARSDSRGHSHLSPSVMGVLGTLSLHLLIFPSAILGIRTQTSHPPAVHSPGSSLSKQDTALPNDGLVLIDLPYSIGINRARAGLPVTAQPAITMSPITRPRLDPPPLPDLGTSTSTSSEDTESAANSDGGDGVEQARLVGIYSGQMKARVERIWQRPRSPVSEDGEAKTTNAVEYFQCQVQIVQDPLGNVQEILLPQCNGSVTWQRSLVVAIQQASPLPAPPSPKVFSRTVTLNFQGYPYTAGASDADYEPAPARTALSVTAYPQ